MHQNNFQKYNFFVTFITPNPIIVYYNAKKRKIMVENLVSGKKLSLNHAIRIADRDFKKKCVNFTVNMDGVK